MEIVAEEVVALVERELAEHANPIAAQKMSAYMKNRFTFYGIASPLRKNICRHIYEAIGRPTNVVSIAKQLWVKPQRELHYIAQEMLLRGKKEWTPDFVYDLEWFISTNSWWDTVDFIASNLVAEYFKKWPECKKEIVLGWNNSDNMWLVRTSIVFQLKYKNEVDTEILQTCIIKHSSSKEFFIKKAIGWSLRQYAKYDAEWVQDFLENNELQTLSVREATKHF